MVKGKKQYNFRWIQLLLFLMIICVVFASCKSIKHDTGTVIYFNIAEETNINYSKFAEDIQTILTDRFENFGYKAIVDTDNEGKNFKATIYEDELINDNILQIISKKGEIELYILEDKENKVGESLLDNNSFTSARIGTDDLDGKAVVIAKLNDDSIQKMAEISDNLAGKQVGVFVDDEMVFRAMVNTTEMESIVVYHGNEEKAEEIVCYANSGSLPFELEAANDAQNNTKENTENSTNKSVERSPDYDQIISIINDTDLNGDDTHILTDLNIPNVVFYGSSEFGNNKILNLDINNDGKEEYIEVGFDTPNGMKILTVKNDYGYNLFNDTVFPNRYFDDYGNLMENCFIQVAWHDFNKDNKKEAIIIVGDDESHISVRILEDKLQDEYLSPFIETGSFEGEDVIYISNKGIVSVPIHSSKSVNTYNYGE